MPGLNLPGIDLTQIARGYGAHAVRAQTRDDVADALEDAAGASGPTVIVVPIDRDVPDLL